MATALNWAVLGTGTIANEMAAALQNLHRCFYGVCSRNYDKAVLFAAKYKITKVYRSYEELCQDPQVDVVYIATPHNTHYNFIKQALNQGKHVLAEKAITLNSRELEDLQALAARKGVILAEAMTIWHMPLYKKLWQIIASGKLGQPQILTLNFGSFKDYTLSNRFFNMDLAGGALLDIGVYALSAMRSFMSETPTQLCSQRKLAPTGADEQVTLLLSNTAGQMATIALSLHSRQPKRAMISCEKAYIEIMNYPRACKALIVDAANGQQETIEVGDTKLALQYELEDMEEAILTANASLMKITYSADVMKIMTRIRQEWQMQYPGENW